MGVCNSPDIFQDKMSSLMQHLNFVRTYLDDLLIITNASFKDHLEKLGTVLKRLQQANLRINIKESFFGRTELEYLGFWITATGIQPLETKIKAILAISPPMTKKEL